MLPLNIASPIKIREVLTHYGVARAIESAYPGEYPIFVGQVILKTLGSKVGKGEQLVYHLDPEVDCEAVYQDVEGADALNICDAYYDWAQKCENIVFAKEWRVTKGVMIGDGETDGRLVVNLINLCTGMAIPFYM
jgi:hypothetical protein